MNFLMRAIFSLLLLFTLSIPRLLYTSDAADDRISVDLGGRRIIKKKKKKNKKNSYIHKANTRT
ncbi:hypothetical protein N2056_08220, partial [Escherichia coli]|nr:hypothetical protein [Escherichia coli]